MEVAAAVGLPTPAVQIRKVDDLDFLLASVTIERCRLLARRTPGDVTPR